MLFASALRQSLPQYGLQHLRRDLLAGLTVGIIALPLAMALAVASGVPPQYGLYTSIVAGLVCALSGGSRLSVSGPTAAFVVLLYPVSQQFGPGGLLIATLMAGIMILCMGLLRLGRLIEHIPETVVVGFTAGLGVVIATLQIKDFTGLQAELPGSYTGKIQTLLQELPNSNSADLLIGLLTLSVLVIWPRVSKKIPGHLFALAAGALLSQWFISQGQAVATISSLFSYELNGETFAGIPPLPPQLLLPWELPGPDGEPLIITPALLLQLSVPAFSIALLGAVESLLCAVIADGISGHKHNPDSELVGQGLGNIIAPFFGGITATAAIARTVANCKSGGFSPLAAVFHALVVLAGVVLLAQLLSALPMAALAALLLMIAWNMSELPRFLRLLHQGSYARRSVLLTTFSLTILVDMLAGVAGGIILYVIVSRLSPTTAMADSQ